MYTLIIVLSVYFGLPLLSGVKPSEPSEPNPYSGDPYWGDPFGY